MAKLSAGQKAKILKMIESELEGKTVIRKEPIKYLAEGKAKKRNPIIVKGGVLHNTEGAKAYRAYNKIMTGNKYYKAFKGKKPYGKVQLKSHLWDKVKHEEQPVERVKKFMGYVDEQEGFNTFDQFVALMVIQDEFLSGCDNKLLKFDVGDIKDVDEDKIRKIVEKTKDKVKDKFTPKKRAPIRDVSEEDEPSAKKKVPAKKKKVPAKKKKEPVRDVSEEDDTPAKKSKKLPSKKEFFKKEQFKDVTDPLDDNMESSVAGSKTIKKVDMRKTKVIDEIPREVIDRVLTRLRK